MHLPAKAGKCIADVTVKYVLSTGAQIYPRWGAKKDSNKLPVNLLARSL
jgi:hypothetical protein